LLKATMIYVTHDQTEAMTLADRIVVMNQGEIAQEGKPLDLYYRPANLFVAGFIGSPAMNFFDAVVKQRVESVVTLGGEGFADFQLSLGVDAPAPGAEVKVGVRPEHLRIGGAGPLQVRGAVELVERLGEISYAYARAGAAPFVAEVRGREAPPAGGDAAFGAAAQDVHVFDEAGRRIGA
jgi:ABC-type sugar transport system ATPase subunit